VLVVPDWIGPVDWASKTVAVDLSRETVKQGPEYDPAALLNREYEVRLHKHYRRRGYWEDVPKM
jgi:hypothetical protein